MRHVNLPEDVDPYEYMDQWGIDVCFPDYKVWNTIYSIDTALQKHGLEIVTYGDEDNPEAPFTIEPIKS